MKEKNSNLTFGLLAGFLLGVFFIAITFALLDNKNIIISQETADDLCIHVTNNETAIAKDFRDFVGVNNAIRPIGKGQMVCELPNFDSTHNIVVQTN